MTINHRLRVGQQLVTDISCEFLKRYGEKLELMVWRLGMTTKEYLKTLLIKSCWLSAKTINISEDNYELDEIANYLECIDDSEMVGSHCFNVKNSI